MKHEPMTVQELRQVMSSATRCAEAQRRVSDAAIRLLRVLQELPDGRASEVLLKLLRPLYVDYAAMAQKITEKDA